MYKFLTNKLLTLSLMLLCGLLIVALLFFSPLFKKPDNPITITQSGVVTEIQKLSRLTSVAFSVDTVITAEKTGNWYKLWQDEQKGLFVAHGRVLAGVDLAKISADMVEVHHLPAGDKQAATTHITITLPPSEIFEVYLDDIQIYDWKTGLFGMVDNDPQILTQAQTQGKQEVLKKACAGNVMQLALDNASEQVSGLFMLSGATVVVKHPDVPSCS